MSAIGSQALAPRDAGELAEAISTHARLEPIGGGSKRAIGRPVDADPLDLSAFDGILCYEPDELVLTARAATPLATIEQALAANSQRLAFEPPDFGVLLGSDAAQTIGGILATNLAGSRRIAGGAARDHFLGFEAVNGRGERFKAGGKVVKNVTGYDLPKLIAGSWGTLAVMTEITIRVAPAAETERTLIIDADSPETALAIMTQAMGSACEVSAAAYDPWRGTALRLEGFGASVASRAAALLALLGNPEANALEHTHSRDYWTKQSAAEALADWPVVWRISVPPSHAPQVLASLGAERYSLDWAGGLIWAAYKTLDTGQVRRAIREGHATLVKAPPETRKQTCTFHPLPASLADVAHRIKAAFDPDNRLNPRRLD